MADPAPPGPLVVADDLGSWPRKSDAILEALEEGLVGAASATAVFPDAERAAAAVRERGLAGVVGAHLVLTEWEPLTDAMRRSRFCDADGRFTGGLRRGHLVRLGADDRRLVAGEVRAQLERLRTLGLPLSHVDSHHHAHNHLPIGAIVGALARELGVPRVRLGRNFGPGRSLRYRAYIAVLNGRLRRGGLAGTTYFGAVSAYRALTPADRARGTYELHAHPLLAEDGRVVEETAPESSLAAYLDGLA